MCLDTSGEDALAFVRLFEAIEAETDARSVLTPQLLDIRLITEHTDPAITVFTMDTVGPGCGMGKILPEAVVDVGVDGVVTNHVRSRDTLSDLVWKTERCRDLDLNLVAYVDSIEMGRAVAEFDPDSMMYEMSEDTSSNRAITQTRPDRVRDFMSVVERGNPCIRVLVGGGISTVEDVRLAFEQGGHATGAASTVSPALEPEPFLRDIVTSFP